MLRCSYAIFACLEPAEDPRSSNVLEAWLRFDPISLPVRASNFAKLGNRTLVSPPLGKPAIKFRYTEHSSRREFGPMGKQTRPPLVCRYCAAQGARNGNRR